MINVVVMFFPHQGVCRQNRAFMISTMINVKSERVAGHPHYSPRTFGWRGNVTLRMQRVNDVRARRRDTLSQKFGGSKPSFPGGSCLVLGSGIGSGILVSSR